ncbi:MAG: cation transporter [Desulfobacterales bacterium]|nr:cation transporter [Desulfobacterales bacterium]
MKYKACERCAKSVGMVNVIGNILMIFIKAYLGIVGRSKGLIADAIHSSADLLATIVMIIGLRIVEKKPNELYPYGYGKAEYVVAILIYLFLLIIGTYIVYDGCMVIIHKQYVKPCLSAAWGAIFSITINELMFRQSVCAGQQINSPSMVAKAWESRSDVYSSIAVLIGVIGAKMGFYFMDPLAAIVVGVVILKICIEMIYDATLNLLDQSPEEDTIEHIRNILHQEKMISGIRNIFGRELGQYFEFEVELFVPKHISLVEGETIKKQIKEIITTHLDRESIIRIRLFATQEG